ncbi:MAG: protein kinase [Chloroflexi bacterium]|nr:protein kinase [Chloroflexota bacterium]
MLGLLLNNRYRILEKIGEGGMARVYRGEDTLLERPVAIKVLREEYARDADFLARFQREARAAAGLTHPNIVAVYDVGTAGPYNYIVMEYVEGHSLKELILREAPLTSARAIDIALQILAALGFAHHKGLIHRDIKPQNVLLTTDGQVKVTDFGLARAAAASQLTETGVILGTVHYCAPEQALGKETTPASDLYAFGVVLYEMLTGKLPFDSDNALGIALKHVQEEPLPPRRLNPYLPLPLEAIILKSLRKDPSRRYGMAEEMAQDLQSYKQLGEQFTVPLAPLPGHGPATAARRSRLSPMAIALAILVLGLFLALIPSGLLLYRSYLYPRLQTGLANLIARPMPTPTPTPTAVPMATVPKLVGLTYDQAKQELARRGLDLAVKDEQYSSEYPLATIIWQSIAPETTVPPRSTIEIILSKGPATVSVPSVIDYLASGAKERLERLGLRTEIKEEWNSQVAAGVVFGQDPPANTMVKVGSLVVLRVSKGKELVRVPLVVGLPEAEARQIIEKARLRNTWPNYQGPGDVPESDLKKVPVGHVLSQTPAAGTLVEPGTTVYLAIRKP